MGQLLAPPVEGALGNALLSNRSHCSARTRISGGQNASETALCPLLPVWSLHTGASASFPSRLTLRSSPLHPSPCATRCVPKCFTLQELASSSLILQTLGPRDAINNCLHILICIWKISGTSWTFILSVPVFKLLCSLLAFLCFFLFWYFRKSNF